MPRTRLLIVLLVLIGAGGALLIFFVGYGFWRLMQPPGLPYAEGHDLAEARRGFETGLLEPGPSPQDYEDQAPPGGVRAVRYASGELQLKAWLSEPPADGRPRPAVVYLHGGWAFDRVDLNDAAPFLEAGFVLMMPMLRGENGNPGSFEHQYGEVDDAVAAGQFVAALPFVDQDNVFLAGHSAGAVIALLAAMVPSRYRAVAALSGAVDNEQFVASEWSEVLPYDTQQLEERRLRNPMAFAASLRCPVYLFVERSAPAIFLENRHFATRAKQQGKSCELTIVPGDHLSMVEPAVRRTIERFREHIP